MEAADWLKERRKTEEANKDTLNSKGRGERRETKFDYIFLNAKGQKHRLRYTVFQKPTCRSDPQALEQVDTGP